MSDSGCGRYDDLLKVFHPPSIESRNSRVQLCKTRDRKHSEVQTLFQYDISVSTEKHEEILDEIKKWRNLTHPTLCEVENVYIKSEINESSDLAIRSYFFLTKHEKFKSLHDYKQELGSLVPINKIQEWFVDLIHTIHYLHSNGVVHQNVNNTSVLLDQNGSLKLTQPGYGFSEIIDFLDDIDLYIDPCVFDDEEFTPQTDIFSLGAVFYTLLCDFDPEGEIMDEYRENNDEFIDLVEQCRSEDAEDRPTLTFLLEQCKAMFPEHLEKVENQKQPFKREFLRDLKKEDERKPKRKARRKKKEEEEESPKKKMKMKKKKKKRKKGGGPFGFGKSGKQKSVMMREVSKSSRKGKAKPRMQKMMREKKSSRRMDSFEEEQMFRKELSPPKELYESQPMKMDLPPPPIMMDLKMHKKEDVSKRGEMMFQRKRAAKKEEDFSSDDDDDDEEEEDSDDDESEEESEEEEMKMKKMKKKKKKKKKKKEKEEESEVEEMKMKKMKKKKKKKKKRKAPPKPKPMKKKKMKRKQKKKMMMFEEAEMSFEKEDLGYGDHSKNEMMMMKSAPQQPMQFEGAGLARRGGGKGDMIGSAPGLERRMEPQPEEEEDMELGMVAFPGGPGRARGQVGGLKRLVFCCFGILCLPCLLPCCFFRYIEESNRVAEEWGLSERKEKMEKYEKDEEREQRMIEQQLQDTSSSSGEEEVGEAPQAPEIPRELNLKQDGLERKKLYEVKSVIGQGGQSSVFLVSKKGTLSTMKRYKNGTLDEFQAEVKALRKLCLGPSSSSENTNTKSMSKYVVQYVEDFGYRDEYGEECRFIIMEYCELGDLQKVMRKQIRQIKKLQRLQNKKKKVETSSSSSAVSSVMKKKKMKPKTVHLETKEIFSLISSLSKGIHEVHSQNYVHHDIKTPNIFITKEMGVRIGDFGFAISVDPNESDDSFEGGVSGGTLKYMSPEAKKGEIGKKYLDIWSMGTLFVEIIVSKVIDFKLKSAEERERFLKNEIWLFSGNSLNDVASDEDKEGGVELLEIIRRCFEEDVEKRITADEIVEGLAKIMEFREKINKKIKVEEEEEEEEVEGETDEKKNEDVVVPEKVDIVQNTDESSTIIVTEQSEEKEKGNEEDNKEKEKEEEEEE